MFKRRAPTPRTMPVWDGCSDPIQHLNDLETFFREGQIEHWKQSGVSEAEIAREAPKNAAQLHARFDQWRSETAARLKLGAS